MARLLGDVLSVGEDQVAYEAHKEAGWLDAEHSCLRSGCGVAAPGFYPHI